MEILPSPILETAALNGGFCNVNVKEEPLDKLADIKQEIPNLFFPQYDQIMKDFSSEDEAHKLDFQLSEASDSDESSDSTKQNNPLRRNRRKPLLPQKTVHSEISQTGSAGTSSECSQDASESIMLNFADSLIDSAADGDFLDLADGEDLLQDIDEENIFKGLQEEAGNVLLRYLSYSSYNLD